MGKKFTWLEIVKKHLKLNPGKSLKEIMPDVKKEYYGLADAVVPPTKTHKKKIHKKSKKSKKVKKSKKAKKSKKSKH